MGDIRQINWANEKTWPYGGARHVFIGVALKDVGRHCLETPWKGNELWHLSHDDLLRVSGALPSSNEYAIADARAIVRRYSPATDLPAKGIDEAGWQAAVQLHPEYLNDRRQSLERVGEAKRKLRELCSEGALVASFRWEGLGSHTDIDAERWNTELFWGWLRYGQASHNEVTGHSGYDEHYLFIEKEGLKNLMTSDQATDFVPSDDTMVTGDGQRYRSPYMKLMDDIVSEMSISDQYQPKVVEIRNIVDREWSKRGFPLSEKLQSAISTMIRLVEKQAGKAANNKK